MRFLFLVLWFCWPISVKQGILPEEKVCYSWNEPEKSVYIHIFGHHITFAIGIFLICPIKIDAGVADWKNGKCKVELVHSPNVCKVASQIIKVRVFVSLFGLFSQDESLNLLINFSNQKEEDKCLDHENWFIESIDRAFAANFLSLINILLKSWIVPFLIHIRSIFF